MDVNFSMYKLVKPPQPPFNSVNVFYVPCDMNVSFLEPSYEFQDKFLFGMIKSFKDEGFECTEQNRELLFTYRWDRAIELYKRNCMTNNTNL